MMPAQLVAGVLEHIACYMRSGSVQAAHRAVLLLERLARDPVVDEAVRERGRELSDTIHRHLGLV